MELRMLGNTGPAWQSSNPLTGRKDCAAVWRKICRLVSAKKDKETGSERRKEETANQREDEAQE